MELEENKIEHYKRFLGNLLDSEKGIKKFESEGLGVIVYGHYMNDGYVNMLVVFPEDVVTDKIKFREISRVLADVRKDNNVNLQIIPIDRTLMSDGRLVVCEPSIESRLDCLTTVTIGPILEYLNYFNLEPSKTEEQQEFRNDLLYTRRGLLLSEHNLIQNDKVAIYGYIVKAVRAVRRAPSRLVAMLKSEGISIADKLDLDFLGRYISSFDLEKIENIGRLYRDPIKLRYLCEEPQQILGSWYSALDCLEKIAKIYVKADPSKIGGTNENTPDKYRNSLDTDQDLLSAEFF